MTNPNDAVQAKHLEAAVEVAKNFTVNLVATIQGGGSAATYSVATTSENGLMSSADKAKLDGLQNYSAGNNITIQGGVISAANTTYTAGSNITINGNTISAGAGGGTYSEATTLQAGLMSATDKQRLDSLFLDTTEFVDTVLAGLSGGVIAYYDNFNYLDNKYQKILAGTDYKCDGANAVFRGVPYKFTYSDANYFGTADNASATRVTISADNSTLSNDFRIIKASDTAGIICCTKQSINSSSSTSKTASISAQAFVILDTGKPSVGSATSLKTGAAYVATGDDSYINYDCVRSIYDPAHIMTILDRPASATTSVWYYGSMYHGGVANTSLTFKSTTASIGTWYYDTDGKTHTDVIYAQFKLKATLQTSGNNVQLLISLNKNGNCYWPFICVYQSTFNSSGTITKYTQYLLVHSGFSQGVPTKIQLSSLASATSSPVVTNPWFEDYGYIAGCWLDKSRTSCYVITLQTTDYISKDTPNLIKTLFDNAAKVFIFDFKTPSIILTDYKLSDIIDELLL